MADRASAPKPIVGMIGLGRMGSAMARRLADVGFSVVGWDKNPDATDAWARAGERTAAHARGVAGVASIVITSVTEDTGVRAVFRGENGVLAAPLADTLCIEMSTLQPQTVRELQSDVLARDGAIVDIPLLGTIPNARAGTLVGLAGGAAADLERARTVLDVLAHRVVHMGPLGSGHAMKLAVNLGLAAYVQGLAESLALGEGEGLDFTQMLEVLSAAPTANAWLAARVGVVRGEASDVTLDIRTMRKDVQSALTTGSLSGIPMPLAAGVLAAFSAAVAAGYGNGDLGEMPRFLREALVQRYD